jgi:hypothetical protein
MNTFLKKAVIPLAIFAGGVLFGSGVTHVVGQKEKNRLKEEARRASDMTERAIAVAEKLAQEKNIESA